MWEQNPVSGVPAFWLPRNGPIFSHAEQNQDNGKYQLYSQCNAAPFHILLIGVQDLAVPVQEERGVLSEEDRVQNIPAPMLSIKDTTDSTLGIPRDMKMGRMITPIATTAPAPNREENMAAVTMHKGYR